MKFSGGSDGGTTQSSLSRASDQVAQDTSYLIALSTLAIAIMYMRITKLLQEKIDELQADKDSSEPPEDNSHINGYEVEFESEATKSINGTDQDLLPPGPDSTNDSAAVRDAVNSIVREDLVVKVKIGDTVIKERSSHILRRMEALNFNDRKALAIAMEGGKPDQEVSITVEDDTGQNIEFKANSNENSGWTVPSKQSTTVVPQDEVIEESNRQNTSSNRSIKAVMNEAKPEDDTFVVHGNSYSVLVTPEAVLVFDKNGLVRESVEIDIVSKKVESAADAVNGMTPEQQRREAVADFGGTKNAKVVSSREEVRGPSAEVRERPVKTKKQRELTP